MSDEDMWQEILDASKHSQGKFEMLQKLTNQVSYVVVNYRDLMLKSCQIKSKADQDLEKRLLILSEVLSPLFGFKGQAVACIIPEVVNEGVKHLFPHQDRVDNEMPSENIPNDQELKREVEDSVPEEPNDQNNLIEVDLVITEMKQDPDDVSNIDADHGWDLPLIDQPARPKRPKRDKEEQIVRRSLRNSKSVQNVKGPGVMRQYNPNYPVDEETFKKILALPRNSIPPKCARCHKSFTKNKYLLEHWRKSKQGCKTNLVLGKSLAIRSDRINPKTKTKEYMCAHEACRDIQTTWPQILQVHRHWNKVHGPDSAPEHCVCPQCGQKFVSSSLLDIHTSENHRESKTCQVCNKVLSGGKKGLERHMVTHSQQSTKCEFCDKKFFAERHKSSHMRRIHRVELGLPETRKHICEVCSKEVDPIKLAEHMSSHAEKPDPKFKCEHCGKQLKQQNSYSKHLMNTHGIGHRCDLCQKIFFNKHQMELHIRNVHAISS